MSTDNRNISQQIELMERLNDEQYEKLTPSELTPKKDARSENSLHTSLLTLRKNKPNDRSQKDRRYAVTITMLKQAYAYFNTYVIQGLE